MCIGGDHRWILSFILDHHLIRRTFEAAMFIAIIICWEMWELEWTEAVDNALYVDPPYGNVTAYNQAAHQVCSIVWLQVGLREMHLCDWLIPVQMSDYMSSLNRMQHWQFTYNWVCTMMFFVLLWKLFGILEFQVLYYSSVSVHSPCAAAAVHLQRCCQDW